MENFERYFLHDRKILLENISYETVKPDKNAKTMTLGCKDTIVAQLMESGIKINFNRAMNFTPEGIFSLSVTDSLMLFIDPTTKHEVNGVNFYVLPLSDNELLAVGQQNGFEYQITATNMQDLLVILNGMKEVN